MSYLIASSANIKEPLIDNEGSSTYILPRVVVSTEISRIDSNNNTEKTVTEEPKKSVNDIDALFQKLEEQMQEKLKEYKENKDKLQFEPPSSKRKSFVNEFFEVKKRFEASMAANTKIYQNRPWQRDSGSESSHTLIDEEKNSQLCPPDEYMSMIRSQETSESIRLNNSANKNYSVQNKNWVAGAMITKVKIDPITNNSSSSSFQKNDTSTQNSLGNNQETKLRDKRMLYGVRHTAALASKKVRNKKKSFYEEFCELRDKIGISPKKENRDKREDSHLLNTENKESQTSSSKSEKQEINIMNSKIKTPYGGLKTSFFSETDSDDNFQSRKITNMKTGNDKLHITADWVKGELITRQETYSTYNFIDSKNREQTPERMYETEESCCSASCIFNQHHISGNDYSKVSPSYTPDEKVFPETRKDVRIFKNRSTSSLTISTMKHSKNTKVHTPGIVVTETKITKLFYPHQINLFN